MSEETEAAVSGVRPAVQWDAEPPRLRRRWVRAGLISGALWLIVELVVGFLSKPGRDLGSVVWLGAVAALLVGGRLAGLTRLPDWIRAGVLGFVVTIVGLVVAATVFAVARFG